MARATSVVRVGVIGDTSQLTRSFRQAEQETKSFADKLDSLGSKLTSRVTVPLGLAAGAGINMASNLSESMNAINKVFGSAVGTIEDYGKTAADSAGLSQRAFNEAAVVLGSALKNAGFSVDETADKTIMLAQRAADMASVFNTSVPDALGAMQAALRGEFDPIERYGVSLSAAKVEAKALEMGLVDASGAVTDLGKKQAAMALIMEQTESTSGDFADTADGLANGLRRLQAKGENLAASLGSKLLPMAEGLVNVAIAAVEGFDRLPDGVQTTTVALVAMAIAAGPAAKALAALNKVTVTLVGTVKGLNMLLAFGGVSSTVGALKAVAKFLGPVAVGVGVATTAIWGFNKSLEVNNDELTKAAITASVAGDEQAALSSAFQPLIKDALDYGKAIGQAAKETEAMRGSQRKGRGTQMEYRGSVDETNDALAEQIEEIRGVQNAFREATDPVYAHREALARHNENMRTMRTLMRDGKTDTDEFAIAVLDTARSHEDLLAAEQELVAYGPTGRQAFIDNARAMGFPLEQARKLADELWGAEDAANALNQTLKGIGATGFNTGGGGGGSQPKARAAGGPVSAGQAYVVGEQGREWFVPSTNGVIIPNTTKRGVMAGGAGYMEQINVYVSGSVVTDKDIATVVRNELVKLRRRNGNTGL